MAKKKTVRPEIIKSVSDIPLRPTPTESQIKVATATGVTMAEDMLHQTLHGMPEPERSLNMHKLFVACKCCIASKIADEAFYGGMNYLVRLDQFLADVKDLTQKQIAHLEKTDPKGKNYEAPRG